MENEDISVCCCVDCTLTGMVSLLLLCFYLRVTDPYIRLMSVFNIEHVFIHSQENNEIFHLQHEIACNVMLGMPHTCTGS